MRAIPVLSLCFATCLIWSPFVFSQNLDLSTTSDHTGVNYSTVGKGDLSPFLDSREKAGIVYFLYESPAVVKRYDLNNALWLPDIVLSGTPTKFDVAPPYLFVAYDRVITRFNLDDLIERSFVTMADHVTALATYRAFLIFKSGNYLYSYSAPSGVLRDRYSFWTRITDLLFDDNQFGVGQADPELIRFTMSQDGLILREDDFHHPTFSFSNKRLFLQPTMNHLLTENGVVLDFETRGYVNGLAGSVEDFAATQNGSLILRDQQILQLDENHLIRTAQTIEESAQKIAFDGDNAVVFHDLTGNLTATHYPITEFEPRAVVPAPNPWTTAWQSDQVVADNQNNLYLIDRSQATLFRWSSETQTWLTPISLVSTPQSIAYDPSLNRLYVGLTTGEILLMDPVNDLALMPFVNLPEAAGDLTAFEGLLFTQCLLNNRNLILTFNTDGQLANNTYGGGSSFTWDATQRRLFFVGEYETSSMLYWYVIDEQGDTTSYHSEYLEGSATRRLFRLPVDAGTFLLGDGNIHETASLARIHQLGRTIEDAVWIDDRLFTLALSASGSALQEWDVADFSPQRDTTLDGQPVALLAADTQLIAVTVNEGRTLVTTISTACLGDAAPTMEPLPTEIALCPGEPAPLSLVTQTNEIIDYQWRHNGSPIEGANQATYEVVYNNAQQLGTYDCAVTTCAGRFLSTSSTVTAGSGFWQETLYAQWQQAPSNPCNDLNRNAVIDILDLIELRDQVAKQAASR